MDEAKDSKAAAMGSGGGGGTLGEPMEGVEGGSCNNGEDIMVEVLGSDVFVDGVRSHEDDGEGGSVGEAGQGELGDSKMDMEVDSKSSNSGFVGSERVEPVGAEAKDGALREAGSSEVETKSGVKESSQEGLVVAEDSVAEETQLIDEERLERNRVDVVDNPADKGVEEVGREKTNAVAESVTTDAMEGPVESNRTTDPSATVEKRGESSDPLPVSVEQNTEETSASHDKDPGVENKQCALPSLARSNSPGEKNLTPNGDDDTRISHIPEGTAVNTGGHDASVVEASTASLEEPASVSVEGEVTRTDKEESVPAEGEAKVMDGEESSVPAASGETLTCSAEERKVSVETVDASIEAHGGILAGENERHDEKTILNCETNQHLKPEKGCLDSKMADGAEVVGAGKAEEVQVAIEQEPVSFESDTSVDNNQEKEGDMKGTLFRKIEEGQLVGGGEPVKVESMIRVDNNNHDGVLDPSEPIQLTAEVELADTMEKAVPNSNAEVLDVTDHMVYENAEMDVEMTEHGECVLKVNEVVLDSTIDVMEVVDNNGESLDGSFGVDLPGDADMKELVTDADMTDLQDHEAETGEPITSDEQNIELGDLKAGSFSEVRASYNLPQEKEGEFAVSDLVWGKVRSHPWWPGQIFDPSDASEKALKHHKKDAYLVAYFGDRTFAWNEASLLKPLKKHFSQTEKQSNSEAFQNAVDCALEEVSRRVELGLTCSCIPNDAREKIKFQIVENAGIKDESCKREGVDGSAKASCFEPDKLVQYMKELAQFPNGGADRMELVIAKAQLLSFYRLNGSSQLPEFQDSGELVEVDAEYLHSEDNRDTGDEASADDEDNSSGQENVKPQKGSLKRKHNLRDSIYPIKKGRSMTELMSGTNEDERRSISVAKVVNPTPPVPKPSFKIGECISRVASQLTGSSILKQSADPSVQNTEDAERSTHVPSEYSSLDDLLSQLQVAAQEPLKEHSFLSIVTCFFSDFRNSVVLDQNPELGKMGGGKRKRPSHLDGSSEAFEFEDMNDSYWTDRIIENGAEELPPDGARRLENHLVPVELKPHKTGRRPYTKRRQAETNHGLQAEKPAGYIDANAPAELVMIFPEFGFFPTEINLNRMFRRFGPLKESETELDRDTSRARVVFKKCSDAEVACSSAGKFNIFGPVHVNYQLNYTVSEEFKSMPIALIEGHEDDIDG